MKGNAYQAIFESFDRRVPGGSKAAIERLTDPDVARFYEQRFLAGSTYDILPMMELSQLGAKIANVPWREFVRGGAAFSAHRDLKGVYRVFLKLASPKMVVERLPRILVQYLTFGSVEAGLTSETRFEAVCRGMPAPVTPWLTSVAEGFIPVVMEAAGAADAAVIVHPPTAADSVKGMPMMDARFSVSWVT